MGLFKHTPHLHQPRNVNHLHKSEMTGLNAKFAVLITHCFGTMQAFYVLVAWMFAWMALATVGVWLFANDRYPFPFLLFCSNLIQLWALPVLAVGQNVLSRKAELQADEAYQTTMKSFHDIEQIMLHLDAQDAEIMKQTALIEQLLPSKRTVHRREVSRD